MEENPPQMTQTLAGFFSDISQHTRDNASFKFPVAPQHFLIRVMRNEEDRKTDSDWLLPPDYPTLAVALDPEDSL